MTQPASPAAPAAEKRKRKRKHKRKKQASEKDADEELARDVPKNKEGKRKKTKRTHLPPHKLVVAPMVGKSDLAFRLLCRR